MSNLQLTIGGRDFAVACAPGEEEHVAALGRMIDAKVADMGGAGKANEARMLLFGALLLADELHEARNNRRDAGLPSGMAGSDTVSAAPANAPAPDLLDKIAERLENLAQRLEDLDENP